MRTIFVIGGGGIGSWLVPSLCLLEHPDRIVVVDKDKLEEKNLNRQLFTVEDIGRPKAEALSERYGCRAVNAWFAVGAIKTKHDDWLMVCVDNHPARKEALDECDRTGCTAIIACNETTSAEAFIYNRNWRDHPFLDPRRYYPEILTGHDNDPRAASIGCTGEAQRQNPQLVSANFMAASLAQHLFVAWARELPKCRNPKDVIPHIPHKLTANSSLLQSESVGSQFSRVS